MEPDAGRARLTAVKMLLTALAAACLLTACGSDGGTAATDPGGTGPSMPAAIPAAPGTVYSGLVTVMDTGTPEVCFGPVAESWPPQCTGPELVGWNWAEHRQMFDHQGSVRWGQFALSGTWDGERFIVESAIPAALYDPMPTSVPVYPPTEPEHTRAELEEIAAEVGQSLPGAQGAYVDEQHVLVDVIYDNGSLQTQVGQDYPEGVVIVRSSLTDSQTTGGRDAGRRLRSRRAPG